jgi:AraC-like DNA-binding protein
MIHNLNALFQEVAAKLSLNPRMHLDKIAYDLGADRHTIEDAVNICAGVKFREYRNIKLLDKGIFLLQQTDLSIKQIAIDLDYSAFDSFSRFIKHHTGETPRQIRQKIQKT